jgi:uncharacterized protein YhaN
VRLAEDQRTAAAAALTSVTGGEAVPDAVAVAAARRLREQGWHLVYRLAFTPDPPTPDEQRDFSGGQPLPLAYERAVQHADAVADRRVAEADLIARATAAQAALQAAADAVDAQAAVLPVAQRAVDAAEAEWTAACAPLGLGTAPGIEDVRAFLTARERVVERAEALQRAQSAEARLSARHAEWASRLAAAMAASPNSALPALLAQVEARLAEAGRREKQRIALDAGLRELRLKREQAEANLTKAHEKLAAWQAEWTASLAQLGRPAGEPPAVTADILQLLTDLDADRKQAARLAERVQDMRADNTAFTAAVAALLGRDARDLASPQGDTGAMLTAIRTLRERLQAERARATKRTQLREQIAQADRQITQLRQRLAQRQAEEQQVLRAIGADTLEAAEQRLAASRERAGHAEALARATAKLREDGDALPIETLRAELAAIAADDAPAALAAAETAMAAANTAAQQQAADAARQHRDLDQRTADAGYESAISDQQAGMATLARVLDEAMQYRLAALLLGRALAAVEGQDTPAMLTRIGGYFRTLTDGAYERVVVAEDDTGGLALTMIPRDLPDEHKRVGDLSEGTRDQLFLALRLAAIEDHVAAGPALPFVGDDILQTSDDARATAALHALCDLSRHVQVILLTHHAHIQQLAAALPTDAVHVCALAEGAMVAA